MNKLNIKETGKVIGLQVLLLLVVAGISMAGGMTPILLHAQMASVSGSMMGDNALLPATSASAQKNKSQELEQRDAQQQEDSPEALTQEAQQPRVVAYADIIGAGAQSNGYASGAHSTPNKPAHNDAMMSGYQGMAALSEEDLSAVNGQALFVADKIDPDSLTGAASQPGTGFTYYRMGLDVELAMNANIGKLQLGCGGINDRLTTDPACDIDMDYVRFMGRDGTDPGDPVTSEFVLRRPYVSLAIRDDATPTTREVVGIKIGAESVDGYVGAGRVYTTDGVNLENGGPNCDVSDIQGNGVLGCHSGINSISGFIGAELSARFPLDVTIGGGNAVACAGYLSPPFQGGAPAACTSTANRLFLDLEGTRMDELLVTHMELAATGGLLSWFSPAYAQLRADTRLLHGFAMVDTEDFYLSFQREIVSWPRFSKTTPPTTGATNCNTSQGGNNPARCSSAYAVPANTGWWMNVPEAKLVDVVGAEQTIPLSDLGSALGPPGLLIPNPELNLVPPDNCWTGSFC